MKPLSLKEKAIEYRKQGYSYNMISEKLGLAKSTLSGWLHDIDFTPNRIVLSRIKRAKRNLVKTMYKRRREALKIREKIRSGTKSTVKSVTKKDLWYAGSMLYLAEGSKASREVRITNSNPQVIKLICRWLREVCKVKLEDFSATIHLYPDNNVEKSIRFWSRISQIPIFQFQKTQIDRRVKKLKTKKKKLPYGTLHIRIRKSRDLFYKIMGWTDGIIEKAI